MVNKSILRNTIISFVVFLIVVTVILLAVFLTRSTDTDNDGVIIQTSIGDIRGSVADDGDYVMFLGIPYAEVNQSNPFAPSTPYPEFEDIFEANNDSAICPQVNNLYAQGIETLDCLNLNVFTPSKDGLENLPVMVFIFGGSYRTGSYNRYLYGPKFLVQHDVILVTVNFRVGIYGFMCLDSPEIPGNQGLKDQLLALKWIKNHIKSFGGDDENITIFGFSSGGRSVDFHLIFNEEKLFDKAILQSGNSLSPPGVSNIDNRLPIKVAEQLNFHTENVMEAVQFLSSASTHTVSEALAELGYDMFRPCVENKYDNVDSFLTEHPLVKKASFVNNTSILIGYTDYERVFAYRDINIDTFDLPDLIRSSLNNYFNIDNDTLTHMVDIVQRLYLGDQQVNEETKRHVINFDTDFMYLHPTQRRIYDYINFGARAIYHYKFSFDSNRNYFKNLYNISDPGASHTDDLSYLFDVSYLKNIMSQEEQLTVDRLTTLWTNFAKYGDPTPEITELLPVKWEPVTEEVMYYYNIGSNLTLDNRPFNRRLSFWDLFFRKNGHLQKGFSDDF